MKKKKHFYLAFKVEAHTNIEVLADSLEDALVKAKEYGVTDVIDIPEDYVDGSLKLTGVYE